MPDGLGHEFGDIEWFAWRHQPVVVGSDSVENAAKRRCRALEEFDDGIGVAKVAVFSDLEGLGLVHSESLACNLSMWIIKRWIVR